MRNPQILQNEKEAIQGGPQRAWRHLIGRQAYYVTDFVKEALQKGVALRVDYPTMVEMKWGDLVVVMGKLPGMNNPVMFLEFPISCVYGISREAAAELKTEFECSAFDMGGELVERKSAVYSTGLGYYIDADLCEISVFLEYINCPALVGADNTVEGGYPMIGCGPEKVHVMAEPWMRFRNTTLSADFSPFDIDRVRGVIENTTGDKRPSGYGDYDLNMENLFVWPRIPYGGAFQIATAYQEISAPAGSGPGFRLKVGDRVDYHYGHGIGGEITSRNHEITRISRKPNAHKLDVAWISDKLGPVYLAALTLAIEQLDVGPPTAGSTETAW